MNNQPARRKVIAVDIDDVLADSARVFIELSNQHWGTNFTVEDYTEDWATLWGITPEEIEPRAHVYRSHLPSMQSLGAHEALKRLSARYDLIIVTARAAVTKDPTLEWIRQHYADLFADEAIHFAGIWDNRDEHSIHETKGSMLQRLRADYHIDDQPKHCIGAHEYGVTPLLFGDYAWNRSAVVPEAVTRVKDWQAVLEYFDGIQD